MSKNLSSERKANSILYKVTLVLAKIAEILHWGLAGVMLICMVCAIIWSKPNLEAIGYSPLLLCYGPEVMNSGVGASLSCYGFEMTNGGTGMLVCFMLGSMVILSLMAMVFRNVYLILKTAQGKTWFAKGDTPFQQNIVRMLREIGVFLVIISLASLVSTVIVDLLGGEIAGGFNYLSGFMGLVFICISQFFNYGKNLEKDLDGLV